MTRLLPGITIRLCILLLAMMACNVLTAQEMQRSNFRAAVCNIETMEISFKLDEAFGEPLLTSKMRWQAGPNTQIDCLTSLTQIWLMARSANGGEKFIRISPTVGGSGAAFAPTVTESPSWSRLFCDAPSDESVCEDEAAARIRFTAHVAFERFEVASQALTISRNEKTTNSSASKNMTSSSDSFSLESLLDDVIDTAIENKQDNGSTNSALTQNRQAQARVQAKAQADARAAEDTRNETIMDMQQRQADEAINTIKALLSGKLATYKSPAHSCESERQIRYSVKSSGNCQLNFRMESSHKFLCADSGKTRTIKTNARADINLRQDLNAVSDIRLSDEGWATFVLELNDDLHVTSDGNYKTNRWQFVGYGNQQAELQQLAGNLISLKQLCISSY